MSVVDRLVNYRNRVLTSSQRAAGASYVLAVNPVSGVAYNWDGASLGTPTNPSYSSLTAGATGKSFITDGGFQNSGATSGSALFSVGGSAGGAQVKGVTTNTVPSINLECVGSGAANGEIKVFRVSTTLTGGASYFNIYQPGTTTVTHRIKADNGDMALPKTSGVGIKVDCAAPTFPWRDLFPVTAVANGGIAPSWAAVLGSLRAWQFTVNDEIQYIFHVPHDYVPGTDLYVHAHWCHPVTGVTGGAVTFSVTTSVAKGFDQAAFPAGKTVTITQNASPVQYRHMVAEGAITTATAGGTATLHDRALIEPDAIILMRFQVTANTMTGTPEPFVLSVDIHYQSSNLGTKQKAPDFYT